MQNIILLFASLFLAFQLASMSSASAATPLTLSAALQQAHVGTPQTQRADSMAAEAVWKTRETYSAFLPSLSAQATYLTDKKYLFTDIALSPGATPVSIPGIVPTSQGVITAQYLLFDGFASTHRLWASQSFEKAADKEAEWSHFQTTRQIELRFYQALAAKYLREVSEQNLKVLEDHLRDASLLKKAGVSTNYDVLRVEVQVSEARSEVLNANDTIAVAASRLAEVLGQEESPEVQGQLPVLEPQLVSRVDLSSAESRPDLQAQAFKTQGFLDSDSSAGRYWVPKLSLFGMYQYYNNRNDKFDDWTNYREAYQVGLNLTWNIFDGMTSLAKSHEAIEERVQAEKTLRIAQLKGRQDLDLWKRKFIYFCGVYKSRQGDIDKAKESVRLAREGRRVGARTTTDLLDAEAELYRAEAGAVNAQVGAIEALVNLELATGQTLYKFN